MHLTKRSLANACFTGLALLTLAFATTAFATTTSAQTSSDSTSAQLATAAELPKTSSTETVTPTPTPTPTPEPAPQNRNNVTDRVLSYDRNAPRRDNLTGIKIVNHVNGLFGGFEQGGGFGFGAELTTAKSIPGVEFRLRALTSTKYYRKGELDLYIPKLGSDNSHAEVYYSYLRRTHDNFFGIGPRTSRTFFSNYDIEQRAITGSYFFDITKRLQAGFFAQHRNTSTYPGTNDETPPVTQFFTGNLRTVEVLRLAPGLQNNTDILSYGGYAEFNGRNDESGLTRGGYFYGRLSGNNGRGSRSSIYGWTEVELDGRAYIPLGSNKTSFAVRAVTELKKPHGDDLIPFYDLSFLGGRSYVRGFDNYRFRGNNLLLFSAELRQTVWAQKETRGVDVIGFGDMGQVWGDNRANLPLGFRDNDRFTSHNWRSSAGFAVQFRYNHAFAVRLDYAHTNEKNKVYFSVSRGF